jgi:hypothetical protein
MNMQWCIGFSFVIAEDSIPICSIITIDLLGYITCIMFDDKYLNTTKPAEWLLSAINKMKELRAGNIIKIDSLFFVVNKKDINALLRKVGFKKDGEKWIYSLV